MFRTVVSVVCAIAVFAPTAAFAGDWHDRNSYRGGAYNRPRVVERVRTIDYSTRNRAFERRDIERRDIERRDIERRDIRAWERREAERARYLRERRDDRFRRGYDRDRYNRPSIIIIPRISF